MRVTVRLFARLRDIAGSGELTREAPAGANVGMVWSSLVSEFPAIVRLREIDLVRGERRLLEILRHGGGR